jgi:hypothetical protein
MAHSTRLVRGCAVRAACSPRIEKRSTWYTMGRTRVSVFSANRHGGGFWATGCASIIGSVWSQISTWRAGYTLGRSGGYTRNG